MQRAWSETHEINTRRVLTLSQCPLLTHQPSISSAGCRFSTEVSMPPHRHECADTPTNSPWHSMSESIITDFSWYSMRMSTRTNSSWYSMRVSTFSNSSWYSMRMSALTNSSWYSTGAQMFVCVVTRSTTAEVQHNDMMMRTNVQN